MEYEFSAESEGVTVTVRGEDRETVQAEFEACLRFVREADLPLDVSDTTGEAHWPRDGAPTPEPGALAPVSLKTGLPTEELASTLVVDPDGSYPPTIKRDDPAETLGDPEAPAVVLLYLLETCYDREDIPVPALAAAIERQNFADAAVPSSANEYVDIRQSDPPTIGLNQAGRVQGREYIRTLVLGPETADGDELAP